MRLEPQALRSARSYAEAIVAGVVANREEIDELIRSQAVNWRLERMPVVDRTVLRIAVYELLKETDVPQVVIVNEAIELAKAQATKLTMGDPFDAKTRLGPLASANQRDTVLGYIDRGKQEGAKLVSGGSRPAAMAAGYFVEPTIFADVRNDMTIAQEEIFGPVLSIIPYDSEREAIDVANDSIYGLSGGVWAGSTERALEVARRIRTGQVDINGGSFNIKAPFGGYKQSGDGRELGKFGLDEFLEVKSLQLPG